MTWEKHPCEAGLTPACIEAYPEWAKQALAYRLLHVLIPAEITRRLPKLFWRALIGPGAVVPPDVVFPPGTVIPPGFVFPPGWKWWMGLPPGVVVDPGTYFPPGWVPGDPDPPGVIIDPGAVFPEGWQPGDTLPPGVTAEPAAAFPAGWRPGDRAPRGVTIPPGTRFPAGWQPQTEMPAGALRPPIVSGGTRAFGVPVPPPIDPWALFRYNYQPTVIAAKLWFWEPWDNLTTHAWEPEWYPEESSVSITVDKRLRLFATGLWGGAWVTLYGMPAYPENYDLSFISHTVSGTGGGAHYFWTGVYRLQMGLLPPNRIRFYFGGGDYFWNVANYMNRDCTWVVKVRGTKFSMYQDGSPILENLSVDLSTERAGEIYIYAGTESEHIFDELAIWEIA